MVGLRLAWELFLEPELRKLLNLNAIRLLQPMLLTAKYCQRATYTQSILDIGLASPDCRLATGASEEWFAMRMRTSSLCASHGEGQGYASHGMGIGRWKTER